MLKKKEYLDGVNIIRMRVWTGNRFFRLISYVWMIPATIRLIRRSDIIIIYGKYFTLHRLVIITGKILGKYLVFRSTLMGEDDMDSLLAGNQITKWIRKKIYSRITMYFAITPLFSSIFSKNFKHINLFESCQGVDSHVYFPESDERKTELRKILDIPESITLLLSVGSLIARKGYREIFDLLSEISIPFIYVIAGETDVSISPHLKPKVKEINEIIKKGKELLGPRIRFIGVVDNLNSWYNIADLFIHNSRNEGLPNSLLECLSCGTTPLIRYINGLDNYLLKNGKNAYQFINKADFKAKLSAYLKDPSLIPYPDNEFAENIRQKISFQKVYNEFVKAASRGSKK